MNIWNKVLLGLIAVMLLPLFYFSLVALRTHEHWRSAAKKIEAQLPGLEEEIQTLKYGDPLRPDLESLQSLRIEMYKYLVNRGGLWRNCVFQRREGNEISVGVEKPDPHGIAPESILLVFDEASMPEGGCFLGEFKVKGVDKNQVTLEPTMRLSPKALERILASEQIKDKPVLWTLREIMPNDMREPFAKMDEEQLRAALPAAVVDEYLGDGKNGKERPFRDYQVLIKGLDHQWTVLLEELEEAKKHEQYMKSALADAKKQELFRQDEIAALTAKKKRMETEAKSALGYEESLAAELKSLEATIAQLAKDNQAVAAELAKMQAKMLRQVDRRATVARQ